MSYTKLTASGDGIVMDDSFFTRAIDLDALTAFNPPGYYGSGFQFGIYQSPLEIRTEPYPVGVSPQYGLYDLFNIGSSSAFVVAISLRGFGFPFADTYVVKYYDLVEPPSIGSFQIFEDSTWSAAFDDPTDSILLTDLITATVGTLYDQDADNEILGSIGDDVLRGFGGKDLITGSAGSDVIYGGSGNDTLGSYGFHPFDQPPLDAFPSSDDGGDDRLFGEKGNDELYGDNGVEMLDGGKGNDLLVAYAGNDKLDGGDGNDTLSGGVGRDVLKGGTGADGFFYKNKLGEGADKIVDFDPAGDSILVSAAGFELINYGLSVGSDIGAAGRFASNINGRGTTPGFAQFVYDSDEGKLFWDADGKGGSAGTLLATLVGVPVLTAADIVIVA